MRNARCFAPAPTWEMRFFREVYGVLTIAAVCENSQIFSFGKLTGRPFSSKIVEAKKGFDGKEYAGFLKREGSSRAERDPGAEERGRSCRSRLCESREKEKWAQAAFLLCGDSTGRAAPLFAKSGAKARLLLK